MVQAELSKKQKVRHSRGSQTSAAFWDDLSKVWLTRRALREHDRRSIQAPPSLSSKLHRPAHWPVTQHRLTEPTRSSQNGQHTAAYIRYCCEPSILEKAKPFAKHGGPDLLDLRNVRTTSCLLGWS